MLASNNGAASWTPFNTGLTQSNVYALALNPTCYSRLLAGTDSGVWHIDLRNTANSAGRTAPELNEPRRLLKSLMRY